MENFGNYITSTVKSIDKQIEELENSRRRLLALSEKYIFNYELKVTEWLKKNKFEVRSFRSSKTGLDNNWTAETNLKISLALTSNTFRFIKFKGYTSSGAGKNQSQLKAKAAKLRESFKEFTGLESVNVNEFSIEANEDGNNQILLDFWVK